MCKAVFIIISTMVMLSACTSKKKYTELAQKNAVNEARIKKLEADSVHLSEKLDVIKKQLSTLAAKSYVAPQKESKKILRGRAAEDHYKQISFFLFNIIKYVEWSSIQEDRFIIAILGNDPLFKEIGTQFNGKKVGNRIILVKKITHEKEICHADVYFVSHQKLHFLTQVYKTTKNEKALIVSDHHHLTAGVHVSFFLEGENLKFDLNEEEILKSNIVMSSTLKSLQN